RAAWPATDGQSHTHPADPGRRQCPGAAVVRGAAPARHSGHRHTSADGAPRDSPIACYPVRGPCRDRCGSSAGGPAADPCRITGVSVMKPITLLPGSPMAAETVETLCEALQALLPEVRVAIEPHPAIQLSSLETDLISLAQRIEPGVQVGWSLGGMLAVQLNPRFPEHFPAVATLASNACFVE